MDFAIYAVVFVVGMVAGAFAMHAYASHVKIEVK